MDIIEQYGGATTKRQTEIKNYIISKYDIPPKLVTKLRFYKNRFCFLFIYLQFQYL